MCRVFLCNREFLKTLDKHQHTALMTVLYQQFLHLVRTQGGQGNGVAFLSKQRTDILKPIDTLEAAHAVANGYVIGDRAYCFHTRLITAGDKSQVQPFYYGSTLLAHNGTVYDLIGHERLSDTHMLAILVGKHGYPLESLAGRNNGVFVGWQRYTPFVAYGNGSLYCIRSEDHSAWCFTSDLDGLFQYAVKACKLSVYRMQNSFYWKEGEYLNTKLWSKPRYFKKGASKWNSEAWKWEDERDQLLLTEWERKLIEENTPPEYVSSLTVTPLEEKPNGKKSFKV